MKRRGCGLRGKQLLTVPTDTKLQKLYKLTDEFALFTLEEAIEEMKSSFGLSACLSVVVSSFLPVQLICFVPRWALVLCCCSHSVHLCGSEEPFDVCPETEIYRPK